MTKLKTATVLCVLVVLAILCIPLIRAPDLEVFGGPVATGTPDPCAGLSAWSAVACGVEIPEPTGTPEPTATLAIVAMSWVWTTLDQGGFAVDSTGTITISEPFARAMRDAIGRLE